MSQKQKEGAREYGAEFKLRAVQRALAGERIATIADELGIRRKLIYSWKDRYAERGEAGLAAPRGRPRKLAEPQPPHEPSTARGELLAARRRIAELERKVGQQELELDFFEQVLQRVTAASKTTNAKPSMPASSIASKKTPPKPPDKSR
jgi:transposase-like protein